MRNCLYLIFGTLLCSILLGGAVFGGDGPEDTTLFLQSIDTPQPREVVLHGDPFQERQLVVKLDGQTICFSDYSGMISARTLHDRFLELQFDNRCGTGCWYKSYMLICIKDGQLQTAVPGKSLVGSYYTAYECMSDSTDNPGNTSSETEYSFHVSRVNSSFELTIIRHFTFDSPCVPDTNITDSIKLPFNREFGVFCAELDTLDGCFGPFVSSNMDSLKCVKRTGVVAPVFRLYGSIGWDYFVDGAWCFYNDETGVYLCGEGRDCFYDR